MINIEKQIEYWVTSAEEDIETAKILIINKRYVYGLFFCHLAIEKTFKAHIVKHTQNLPPKIHKLLVLLEKTNLEIDDENKLFLGKLMDYYIEGRYPEYYPQMPSDEKAKKYLDKTKQLFEWLKEKLQ